MLKTMEWHIETLPDSGIWTGSADHKKMTAIKGTSLLGGMRFWTEALLRSFGHKVCDCVQSKEVFDKKEQGKVCAACHSFGCTGLSRAFSLRVMPENMKKNGEKMTVTVTPFGQNSPKTTGMGKQYSLAYGWQGRLTLAMSCRRPLSWPPVPNGEQGPVMLPPEVLLATLLMLEYGALGAHDQYGCGLVRLLGRDELLPKLQACALPQDDSYASKEGYADLRDFFFFKGRLDQQKLERQSNCTVTAQAPGQPLAPSHAAMVRVRRLLRDSLRGQGGDTTVRHWLCGTLKPKPTGSHISLGVSAGTLYGWGWLPRAGIPGLSGSHWPTLCEKSLAAVHAGLQGICPDLRWKEFASAREAAAPKDWRAYVTEMIAQPWRDA